MGGKSGRKDESRGKARVGWSETEDRSSSKLPTSEENR
jgi:hypothetical protein